MKIIRNSKNFLDKIFFIGGEGFLLKIYKIFLIAFAMSFLEFLGLGLFVSFMLSIFGNENFILKLLPSLSNIEIHEMMIILFLIYSIKLIMNIFFQYKIYTYLFELHYELSKKLLSSYLKKPYIFFSKANSSFLTRNIYSEVGIFTYQVIISFSILITDIILILSLIFLLMLNDSVSTFIISFLLISFYFIYYFISKPYVKKWGQILADKKFVIHNTLKETFSSIKEIKIFNIENFFLKKFNKNLFEYSKSSRNQTISSQLPKFFFEYIIVVIFILMISYYYFQGFSEEKIFSNITLFAAVSLRLMPCFARISTQSQSITFYKPSVDILYEEFRNANEYDEILTNNENLIINKEFSFKNSIDIKNLNFSFADKKIFKDINLQIPKNKIIGLFGKSGEGKTTFVDIICGLMKPSSGKILLDNNYDIHVNDLNGIWKKKIGYVTQSNYLLNDTIKNNILYGLEDFDNDKFNNALINSQFEEVVKQYPERENTLVGENGINFSGGQIKRLAIARALYRNPELLIFDETTSSLDAQNEKNVFEILNNLKLNKSIIIISHNKETLRYCDQVYEFKDGKILKNSTMFKS